MANLPKDAQEVALDAASKGIDTYEDPSGSFSIYDGLDQSNQQKGIPADNLADALKGAIEQSDKNYPSSK